MFQLFPELTAPSFYLWEPPRRFLKEPYISAHNSVPVQKDHFSAHGNFYKCFSKVTFWGEIFFFKKVLNFLSFFGLLYVSGHFKQKQFFFSNSHSLFAILVGQLPTRAAVKELGFRAEAGAVGSPRAESELQLRLSFLERGYFCSSFCYEQMTSRTIPIVNVRIPTFTKNASRRLVQR